MTEWSIEGGIKPPSVQWNHIDGPMMNLGDGRVKWLSYRERFMLWIGRWSLEDIARRPYNFNNWQW